MSGKENYPWQDFGFLETHHFHFLKWPFLHPHFSNYFSPFSLLRKKKILSFCTHFHSFRSSFSYSSTYKIFSSFSFSVLDGVGELEPGGGLAGRFSTTSSSRRQCWWWGRIWFISLTDSFYKLCQLSALSASILRLPEQTKTGATLRLPKQTETGAIGSCWQRHI